MRQTVLGLAGSLTLATIAVVSGCSSESDPGGGGGGTSPGASGSGNAQAGSGMGQSGSGMGQSGSGVGGSSNPIACEAVPPCGGNVVGTWTVGSSCLKVSGMLDTSQLSLGCTSLPATGPLQVSGTFTAKADGSYEDKTKTTGAVDVTLAPACLTVSSVAVGCDRIGDLFKAAGWTKPTCSPTSDAGCACRLEPSQEGGMGAIVPYTEPTGSYTTADNVLTATNVSYQYCAAGNKLTLMPKTSAVSGAIVLTGDGSSGGTGGTGAGGAGGGAGGAAGGTGGQSQGGQGGAAGVGGSGGSGGNPPTGMGPCDIYGAANNKCVAAHSMIRALFGAYNGPLYQVKRSDGMTKDIPVKSPGGFADSAQQDTFCAGSTCTVWRIYDQSGNGNFLEAETPDSTVKGANGMTAASATRESLTVGGNKVYSLFMRPAQAYWRDGSKTGMPLGQEPQGIYMVASGTHVNGGCCWNYGNAQLSRKYEGGPTMDAIYFGTSKQWGYGAGAGPWVMADMEDGMLSGPTSGYNPNLPSEPFKYVTAMEKNNGQQYSLRGGDATGDKVTTFYQGDLPAGKKGNMKKQGAIVLGSGGDCCLTNTNLSEGTFYEGAIVKGYPDNATEDAIQLNIQKAAYGK